MNDRANILPLAAEFPAPDRETWMRLVEKALKGGDYEKRMVSQTSDGIRIEPLYTRGDTLDATDAARPGAPPFTRGLRDTVEGLGWSIEQFVAAGDTDGANAAALAELEGGANGVILKIAGPGQAGIQITDGAGMARVLTGVYLDFAPVVLDAGLAAAAAAHAFAEAVAILKAPADRVVARFDIDPIGQLARTGHAIGEAQSIAKSGVTLATALRRDFKVARTILVDGRIAHEAGGSEAQELAVMAASLVAYLRAFDEAGVDVAAALAQTTIALTADADLFLTVAKLRAARRVVARIAEACGDAAAAAAVRIAVTTSARMMTRRDPWTNMLRTTAATAGAAFGGADALTVLPYTWPLGRPDAFAARIARNTQIVAQEESSLGRVVDPAGGSWYVEKLTDDLANHAWETFQGIESAGGIVAALGTGKVQRDIHQTAEARTRAIATGRLPLTGTSTFPRLGDDGVKVTPWPKPAALTGEAVATPLAAHRLAEPFEDLRDAADAVAQRTGRPPSVFLASLGTIADHTARTTWIKNQLAVAGIATVVSDGYASPEAAAAAFRESGLHTACICSSDSIYEAQGTATAKALVEAGATHLLIAGRPGAIEAALRAAGVDGFLYAGQDAIATLTELQHELTA
ncbi:MAG: methylmalonyl-CoA mutase [Hyphomicrobiaceae bacterium]|nr:methylmalonyl-CoA mutase [Hyphomicrobiaceae bacterium]